MSKPLGVMAKFKVKKKAAPVFVDRAELKKLEKEEALFRRTVKQLGSLDALPASRAYLEKSRSMGAAVAKTGEPPHPPVQPSDETFCFQGDLHQRNVVHEAAMHGRDEALGYILGAVSVAEETAIAAAKSSKGRRGARGPARSLDGSVTTLGGERPASLTACLNALDGHSDSALMLAARGGHLECCRLLLVKGADPNAANKSKHTAMHCAALCDELEVLQLLLHFEGDPTRVRVSRHVYYNCYFHKHISCRA